MGRKCVTTLCRPTCVLYMFRNGACRGARGSSAHALAGTAITFGGSLLSEPPLLTDAINTPGQLVTDTGSGRRPIAKSSDGQQHALG